MSPVPYWTAGELTDPIEPSDGGREASPGGEADSWFPSWPRQLTSSRRWCDGWEAGELRDRTGVVFKRGSPGQRAGQGRIARCSTWCKGAQHPSGGSEDEGYRRRSSEPEGRGCGMRLGPVEARGACGCGVPACSAVQRAPGSAISGAARRDRDTASSPSAVRYAMLRNAAAAAPIRAWLKYLCGASLSAGRAQQRCPLVDACCYSSFLVVVSNRRFRRQDRRLGLEFLRRARPARPLVQDHA